MELDPSARSQAGYRYPSFLAPSSQATVLLGHSQNRNSSISNKRQRSISNWVQSKRRAGETRTPCTPTPIRSSHNDGGGTVGTTGNAGQEEDADEANEDFTFTPKPLSLFRKASCLPRSSQYLGSPEDFLDDQEDVDASIFEELVLASAPGKEDPTKTVLASPTDPNTSAPLHLNNPASRPFDIDRVAPRFNHITPIPIFMRVEYPESVPPNSPIKGLTDRSVVRVCFRIGDIFRVAKQNSLDKREQEILFEIFARVRESTWAATPSGCKQFFTLVDLFRHQHPPSLKAELNVSRMMDDNGSTGNSDKSSPNFPVCAASEFLGIHEVEPPLCRAVGIVRRDSTGRDWLMQLFRIMPTRWELVQHMKDIVSLAAPTSQPTTSSLSSL